ncbi:MAG: AAA family ATPase [Pseudomonadales bacterium]|nr:AAA family ATPase [Pseudomonadales bacterium]
MNRALDYRTDFYTLGVTFYHLLTGVLPFEAEDALGLVHAHIARNPEPVCNLREDVPEVISQIIDKLLKKTAEERYQSALGLSKDLQRCRRSIAMNQPLPAFPLGMDDISDRFQVPQRLYGRDKEVKLLMSQFFQATSGNPKMLAIAGYSGIGKSALVHEVHKPIAAHNGLFASGKFDQFQRNVPYSALQQALKVWLQHTLSLSDRKLDELRSQLNLELGINSRVLIDFMPDFQWVLGDLPEVADLGADETKNRFHTVFQKFIKFITQKRPLVIFIDDIQWADRGTLDLLPLLMSEEGCRLLVVVAYRDNEVDSTHPAMKTLKQINESSITAGELSWVNLGPLDHSQVRDLLQDALYRPSEEVEALAELVHKKTAGNPFFVGEFLKTLYTEGLLNFDLVQQRWCWNLNDIEEKGITDNVVELMLGKMDLLPKETQELIQLAACVGSRFDLEMLALVAGKPLVEVTRLIWPALKDGLLLQDGGDWFLGMVHQSKNVETYLGEEGQLLSQSSPLSPHCRFLHDRMLQAAYQSMTREKRRATHLRIGRFLLRSKRGNLTDQERFSIVEQLNQGRSLITDSSERVGLVGLNLQAAQRAQAASVWQAAADYSAVGIELLDHNSWQERYDVSRSLYHIKAECEYLNGSPEESDKYYSVLFGHLKEEFIKAEIFASRLIQTIGRGQWEQGIEYALQGLSFTGIELAPTDSQLLEDYQLERSILSTSLDKVGIDAFCDLPEMTDPKLLIAMRILPNLCQCAAILGNNILRDYCAVKGTNLILSHGKTDLAAIHLACYAYYLRIYNSLDEAHAIAVQARKVAESYEHCREVANCYNTLATTVWYLKSPFSECIDLNMEGMRLGLENGEVARVAMNYCNTLFSQVAQGDNLLKVRSNAKDIRAALLKKSVFHPAANFFYLYANSLIGDDDNLSHALDDEKLGDDLAKIKPTFHYVYLLHFRTALAFWCDDFDWSLDSARKTKALWSMLPSFSLEVDHQLMYGMLLARNYELLSEEEKTDLLECENTLRLFSEVYEENFLHKYLVFCAEASRFQGKPMEESCALYRDAIKNAADNGFIQYQALANELFAEFWLNKGFDVLAEPYVREALYLYQAWGCSVKVSRLREKYSQLLEVSQKRVQRTFSRSETMSARVGQTLDMASVMKSAQLISSELRLPKLAARVLQVIVECAGASSAALITQNNNIVKIEATVDENNDIIIPDDSLELEQYDNLPANIISYVLRSDETVNFGDVLGERAFIDDPYIMSRQPKSVLCMPVDYRDNTIGALYLENSLSIDAFTSDRLDVIKLLLSQSAISFENARLFSEVKTLNQTLEKKVEQRTRDLGLANDNLNQAVRDLKLANEELNAFSYSVSHDLRSPLRGLKGFSKILKDEYSDLLGDSGGHLLDRIIKSSNKMSDLIDGLLELSRTQRREITITDVDLSELVEDLFLEIRDQFPRRQVKTICASGCHARADERMIYSVMENLINNAWKYSSKKEHAIVEFGVLKKEEQYLPKGIGLLPERILANEEVFFVKDNGAGFDMEHADALFSTFQRLHSDKQFPGTGIGLATVKRIIEKHGGNIWVTAQEDKGATFYFTLPS